MSVSVMEAIKEVKLAEELAVNEIEEAKKKAEQIKAEAIEEAKKLIANTEEEAKKLVEEMIKVLFCNDDFNALVISFLTMPSKLNLKLVSMFLLSLAVVSICFSWCIKFE